MLRFRKIIRWVVGAFFASTILAVIAYRFIPVYITPLMVIRCFQNGSLTIHHHWISLDEMSPHMPVAVMASEDARFLLHHGFDFNAIGQAAKNNIRGGRKHGASTISQQTAKNVFLWPGRSWVRKGFEVYFTALMELFWSFRSVISLSLLRFSITSSVRRPDDWDDDTFSASMNLSVAMLKASSLTYFIREKYSKSAQFKPLSGLLAFVTMPNEKTLNAIFRDGRERPFTP